MFDSEFLIILIGGQIVSNAGRGLSRSSLPPTVQRFEADDRQHKYLRRGWMLASAEFRQELLEQTGKWVGPNHFGKERREAAEAGARLRRQTTLSVKEVAQPSHLETPKAASTNLHKFMKPAHGQAVQFDGSCNEAQRPLPIYGLTPPL